MSTTRRELLKAGLVMAVAPNDRISFAIIGAGTMGQGDAQFLLDAAHGGAALVAAADLYDGRLTRVRERWGAGVQTTRDYREILARRDVDAVIIATPDHWHARIAIDALAAGKSVYCEKPMVRSIEEGTALVDAERASGRTFQVGSQYASNLIFHKVRDVLRAGTIGQLNLVEAWVDRNTALGAWQHTLPLDASPETIDWQRFLGDAPTRAFDAIRFFRWRLFSDYGTGLAGDLFIHLLTAVHTATGALGPVRVMSTGGTRYWKDGREAPDIQLALLEYPDFTLSLRVNFASGVNGEQIGFRFYGHDGILHATTNRLTLARAQKDINPEISSTSFAASMQDRLRTPRRAAAAPHPMSNQIETLAVTPPGYDMHLEHLRAFYAAVRARRTSIQDASFGLRAAGPALLCNTSLSSGKICGWDAERMLAP